MKRPRFGVLAGKRQGLGIEIAEAVHGEKTVVMERLFAKERAVAFLCVGGFSPHLGGKGLPIQKCVGIEQRAFSGALVFFVSGGEVGVGFAVLCSSECAKSEVSGCLCA